MVSLIKNVRYCLALCGIKIILQRNKKLLTENLKLETIKLANERIILGIDPGTTIMGFGLIKVVNKKMEFLQLNELILSKYDNHYQKLRVIFERTIELIDTHHPDEIAIEAPFFGKNVQSMLKLGRAQGVAMAAGLSRDIPITEYEPKKIKMAKLILTNGSNTVHALMQFPNTKIYDSIF